MSFTAQKGHTMLLTQITAYFTKLFKRVEDSGTYGSDLEAYIISKNPQTTYDVEYWTNQFDKRQNTKGWML